MTFNNPLSPPSPSVPAPSPDPYATPEATSGSASERQHQPPPQPAAPPSAPPSVDVELMPHNQNGTGGFAAPAPEPNRPRTDLCPPPSPGREGGTKERVQPNGTASSQLSPDPTERYFPKQPAKPEADPLHVPTLP